MTPPMVGSTWPRVRSTLGSDCLPTLSQGTILLYLFMDLLIVIFLSPRAHVRCPMSGDLGVVLVHFIYLLIMRVGARSHGTLYPMTGCVLYLGGLLCWQCGLDLLMLSRILYDSITTSHCIGFAVLWLLVR